MQAQMHGHHLIPYIHTYIAIYAFLIVQALLIVTINSVILFTDIWDPCDHGGSMVSFF